MKRNPRIEKDIKALASSDYVKVQRFIDNQTKILVEFVGPSGSPYEKLDMKVEITMSNDYPFNAPKLQFKPHIFHPNVDTDGYLIIGSLTGL